MAEMNVESHEQWQQSLPFNPKACALSYAVALQVWFFKTIISELWTMAREPASWKPAKSCLNVFHAHLLNLTVWQRRWQQMRTAEMYMGCGAGQWPR